MKRSLKTQTLGTRQASKFLEGQFVHTEGIVSLWAFNPLALCLKGEWRTQPEKEQKNPKILVGHQTLRFVKGRFQNESRKFKNRKTVWSVEAPCTVPSRHYLSTQAVFHDSILLSFDVSLKVFHKHRSKQTHSPSERYYLLKARTGRGFALWEAMFQKIATLCFCVVVVSCIIWWRTIPHFLPPTTTVFLRHRPKSATASVICQDI